jgi:hypothetical protein
MIKREINHFLRVLLKEYASSMQEMQAKLTGDSAVVSNVLASDFTFCVKNASLCHPEKD